MSISAIAPHFGAETVKKKAKKKPAAETPQAAQAETPASTTKPAEESLEKIGTEAAVTLVKGFFSLVSAATKMGKQLIKDTHNALDDIEKNNPAVKEAKDKAAGVVTTAKDKATQTMDDINMKLEKLKGKIKS